MSMAQNQTQLVPTITTMPVITVFSAYRKLLNDKRKAELEESIRKGFNK